MQTTAADKQQTAQATALCVDCAHQIDLGNIGLPRICVLPANTGTDLVAGGPAWLPCTLARADDNVHCGPTGIGYAPRIARRAAHRKSWWTAATEGLRRWLAARNSSAQASTKPRKDISEADKYAAGLAAECFGADSTEALRFTQHIVARNGLPWLTEPAPAATQETQA